MRTPRKITTAALIAIAASLSLPALAPASNPLLSGYGGPGEGNQAIIGSTLIGGAGGGSGSGSSGSGATPTSAAEDVPTTTSGTPEATHSGSAKRPARHATGAGGSSVTTGGVSHAPKATYQPAKAIAAGPTSDSRTLGLSGADLLYIILALALLAVTAALTARISTRTQRDASG